MAALEILNHCEHICSSWGINRDDSIYLGDCVFLEALFTHVTVVVFWLWGIMKWLNEFKLACGSSMFVYVKVMILMGQPIF